MFVYLIYLFLTFIQDRIFFTNSYDSDVFHEAHFGDNKIQ